MFGRLRSSSSEGFLIKSEMLISDDFQSERISIQTIVTVPAPYNVVQSRLEYSWAKTFYIEKSRSKGTYPKNKGFGRKLRPREARNFQRGSRGRQPPGKFGGSQNGFTNRNATPGQIFLKMLLFFAVEIVHFSEKYVEHP